jgi:hypothetical protein
MQLACNYTGSAISKGKYSPKIPNRNWNFTLFMQYLLSYLRISALFTKKWEI